MKRFLIINGKDVYVKEMNTPQDAYTFAQNLMDHSKEVIVREIEKISMPKPAMMELVSDLADDITRMNFGADTMNADGDGYSEEAQDYFNDEYDMIEDKITNILKLR